MSEIRHAKKPNFLFIIVDEQRYPPVYETPEIREWREHNLIAQKLLRAHGMEFHNHYIGSSACCPSRATLFTGQYPSLHGVSQTEGAAKSAFDSDMFWLNPNTVPTMGNYFREAGYQTYYKGKWHVSDENIVIPGTHNSVLSYNPITGMPDPELKQLYLQADRLNSYGFHGWIGPDPVGTNPRNSASSAAIGLSGRDIVYGADTVALIEALKHEHERNQHAKPWLVVASFVNPHDIVLYGDLTTQIPAFRFEAASIPNIPPPPTMNENLFSKPSCQASYRDIYPRAFQPITNRPFYRQLYCQLQRNADQQILHVLNAMRESSFYDNTIIIFTSDHGDLLGAHGDLHQKWYCAYEEVTHVPLIIHNPNLFPNHVDTHILTSHLDLIPTMLGLANMDTPALQHQLQGSFSEVRPFVGRDLAPIVLGSQSSAVADTPIYFMTDDDITKGQHQMNVLGQPYPSVVQPSHIETVIAALPNEGRQELWKLSRYFDNPQFWTEPGVQDVNFQPVASGSSVKQSQYWASQTRTKPYPDQYELYNVTADPLEIHNLANSTLATPYTRSVQQRMLQLLDEQRAQKRLTPASTSIT